MGQQLHFYCFCDDDDDADDDSDVSFLSATMCILSGLFKICVGIAQEVECVDL